MKDEKSSSHISKIHCGVLRKQLDEQLKVQSYFSCIETHKFEEITSL